MTVAEIIQTVIYLAGIGGVAYWVRKWFRALQGAIDAQKITIDTQKALMQGMADFLNIADAPKMAERYQAYRKIVDEEKEALLKQVENRFENEKQALLQTTTNLEDRLRIISGVNELLGATAAETLVALAIRYQLNPLEWQRDKDSYSPHLRISLEVTMKKLPPPPKTFGETFFRPTSPPFSEK